MVALTPLSVSANVTDGAEPGGCDSGGGLSGGGGGGAYSSGVTGVLMYSPSAVGKPVPWSAACRVLDVA